MSRLHFLAHNATQILFLSENGLQTWHRLKRVGLDPSVPLYDSVLYTFLFAGDMFYGKHNRHNAVLYYCGTNNAIGVIDSICRHRIPDFPSARNLVLIRRLDQVDPDPGNVFVVRKYRNMQYKYSISDYGFFSCINIIMAYTQLLTK